MKKFISFGIEQMKIKIKNKATENYFYAGEKKGRGKKDTETFWDGFDA